MNEQARVKSRYFTAGKRYALKEMRKAINEIKAHYPKDVFPDIEVGCAPDRYAASMARHLCNIFHNKLSEIMIDKLTPQSAEEVTDEDPFGTPM